jgi:hypothetical protein
VVERVVLGLHGPARARGRPARVALGDEALHPDRAARGQQVVGGLGTEPVRLGEGAIEVAQVEVTRQRREFVHDHVGLRLRDHARHLLCIKRVDDRGGGAEVEDGLAL